jgi:hypothetical protein
LAFTLALVPGVIAGGAHMAAAAAGGNEWCDTCVGAATAVSPARPRASCFNGRSVE